MRAKQSYLLLDRLQIIKKKIETGFFPSTSDLIDAVLYELGVKVSVPTIYRDICYLKDRGGCDIQFDTSKKGYYINKKEEYL